MALKTKTDVFGLVGGGWEVSDTSENRSVGYTAEAQGPDGFLVAIDVGGNIQAPQVDYIATSDASLTGVVLGSVNNDIALGSVSITTAAGQAPTMTATGQQIESGGTAGCTCTLGSLSVDHLFHAQDFGLFTVSNGQLTQSTCTATGEIATAMVDGVIKSSDLVGGSIEVTGTIIGVSDAGVISTPTITLGTPGGNVLAGVLTQPLTETNPNGDFPSYTFTARWPLKADTGA